MSKYTVKKGHKYKARLSLSWIEAGFATAEIIKEKFTDVGFENVTVKGSGDSWIVSGEWNKEDESAEIPSQVVEIKEETNEIIPKDRAGDEGVG